MPGDLERNEGEELEPFGGFETPADLPELVLAEGGKIEFVGAGQLAGAGATISAVGGCCGLAGNFGVERGHYDVSVAVAEIALLPAMRATVEGDIVLADGFSCRTQLDQLADRDGVHLAQLLAAHLPRPGAAERQPRSTEGDPR